MSEKQQPTMAFPRAPHGTLRKKGEMADWSFPGLRKVSDPTLFQVTLLSALVATVLGNCGPPPILQFASPIRHLNETDFEDGSVLKYTCRPGYSRLTSNQVLTCTSNGQWHYSIFCTKRRCRNPGELPNGEVEVKTDLSLGSQIEFSCIEGYVLVGSTTSHCEVQDKGVDWSEPLPQCVIAKCEAPPDISNGKHSGGDKEMYEYGSSVTYSCDPHFSLIGKASVSCMVENKTAGVWSPSPPTCKQINCPQPKVPHGNIVSGFGARYTYKDSVVFECQKGFILRGSNLIHCEEDNKWNPSPPTCELNSCTGLPDIPHASWGYPRPRKEERYAVGTVFKYYCHSGYKPSVNEPTTVTCQENLRWTPYKGCKELCCPIPNLKTGEIIHHRKSRRSNDCVYFYGDEVSYTCSLGDKFSAVCQPDGTWSPQTPACDGSCNIPPIIAHGHHTGVQTSMFSLYTTYECEEGYTLVGEAKLSCHSSRWSPSPPQCKAQCVKPEIVNGKLSVDKDQYTELENISIHCDSGHNRIGPQSITCLENRTWYPELPKCEWEVAEGCEQVLAGRRLMQCLPKPEDVKMALELYKLSLEIDLLELQRDKTRMSTLETEL
ncbi:C4b-binding protein alpha chain-like [Nycticebus coucang]|uniref:C4b-binding protein alpha chain-like n=1 Tax=Nycticebus coucang TaxID=9470 RepID=UPI00234DC944|nr:C4b-binding protein alpha chain-like [Nycticebus coucang]XP_053463901.1 C4b-binding protein alpha chain-like [Nycticebus coucang]